MIELAPLNPSLEASQLFSAEQKARIREIFPNLSDERRTELKNILNREQEMNQAYRQDLSRLETQEVHRRARAFLEAEEAREKVTVQKELATLAQELENIPT